LGKAIRRQEINMSKLIELRERMAKLATDARAEFDKITDKTTEAEAKEIEVRFDAIMADHDKIGGQAEREEKLASAESRASAGDSRRPAPDHKEQRAAAEDHEKTPEYKEVFSKQLRFGAASLDSEERTVLMSGRANLPQEARAQSTGTDSAGGYTVPEGFAGTIDKALAMWGPMWDGGIVQELNTATGNPLPYPTVDDTASRGRIKAENGAVNDDGNDDVVFGEKMFNAFIYDTGMVKVPLELLQDSAFDIEALMNDLFGERLGRTANQVLTTGTGTGQPNGIVTASTMGKTTAGATAFTADELVDFFHSVDPAYRQSPRCRWMFNDTTLAAIRKLKDGQGNYLWQMGDVRSGEPDTFQGKPYSVNQAMADSAASAKPIIFGDMSKFLVRKVRGFEVMTLRERYAEKFQVGMIGFKRFDSELVNTGAVKHLIHAAS
jgi:HK97 family phage major capsid protein